MVTLRVANPCRPNRNTMCSIGLPWNIYDYVEIYRNILDLLEYLVTMRVAAPYRPHMNTLGYIGMPWDLHEYRGIYMNTW